MSRNASIKDQAVKTARLYYAAKSREERLAIRKQFCDMFQDSYKVGRWWEMIALHEIAIPDHGSSPGTGKKRKTSNKPVILKTQNKTIMFSSQKEAAEKLNMSTFAIHYIVTGKAKNPIYDLKYAEGLQ